MPMEDQQSQQLLNLRPAWTRPVGYSDVYTITSLRGIYQNEEQYLQNFTYREYEIHCMC